ncbi:MAG: AMP-binding protein [Gammaproteobacteria bacterium]|nr:AMP-binding protein [Gammaproteobacteria bacterium]
MIADKKNILIAGDRTLSADELFLQGKKVASGLLQSGLQKGDAVALILRNDFSYFVLHDAARYASFEIVPVNWHLKAAEIDYILKDCKAKAVMVHSDLLTDELKKVIKDLVQIVVPTPGEISKAYSIAEELALPEQNIKIWKDWLDDSKACELEPVLFCPPLFYTSGTSGRPKAVVRGSIPPEVIMKIGERTSFAWGFNKQPVRSVMTGPLYHSAPNGYASMVLQNNGLLVLQPKFDAEDLLRLIELHAITHLHMVPTMFNRLLALPAEIKSKYDLGSLSHVTHGAAPCPPEVKRQMIEWWGSVIYEYYAMTETGIICCSSSEQWLAHQGSVGCAAPGVSIQIRHDDGSVCDTNEIGLICVQHEATASVSYQNAKDKTEDLVQEGYLVTGDIGYLNEDGFLYISDRKSDMVISGGVNIYPAEVENELITIPGVKDCTVFGVPDKEFGEKLVAFIESDGKLDADLISSFLKERIASFKVPRVFEQVTSLPREDSGKLKKREIKEQYLSTQTKQA